MSWMKTLVEHLAEAVIDVVFEPRDRRGYEDEDKHEYAPEDDREPPPPDPDSKGTDIPLHFNAWRDDERDDEK